MKPPDTDEERVEEAFASLGKDRPWVEKVLQGIADDEAKDRYPHKGLTAEEMVVEAKAEACWKCKGTGDMGFTTFIACTECRRG